jgi:polar amino acid transport system permease protein
MAIGFGSLDLLQGESGQVLFKGLLATLELTALAWLIAFAIGILLAVIRSSGLRWADGTVAVYVAYHRNVPLLVQILFWYFGIVTLLPMAAQRWLNGHGGGFVAGAIAIGLCMAAYVSEDLRSGIRAISRGQLEAARAIGLTFVQAMRFVVVPQALRNVIPALVNETLLLFKNTSLLMAIGVGELTYASRQLETQTFRTFEIFAITTVCYLAVSILIMLGGRFLERRYKIAGR